MVVTLCPGEPFARAMMCLGSVGSTRMSDSDLSVTASEWMPGKARCFPPESDMAWRRCPRRSWPRTRRFRRCIRRSAVVERRRNLGPVAAHLAAGHEIIGDVVGCVARGVGRVGLRFLRHVADSGIDNGARSGGEASWPGIRMQQRRNQESGGPCGSQHPSVFKHAAGPPEHSQFQRAFRIELEKRGSAMRRGARGRMADPPQPWEAGDPIPGTTNHRAIQARKSRHIWTVSRYLI